MKKRQLFKYAVYADRKGKKLLCFIHAFDVIDASSWLNNLHIRYDHYRKVKDA
jgi:hypothetical protein